MYCTQHNANYLFGKKPNDLVTTWSHTHIKVFFSPEVNTNLKMLSYLFQLSTTYLYTVLVTETPVHSSINFVMKFADIVRVDKFYLLTYLPAS